ncbi:uncharacterized protein LOC121194074 isoform X2 [Toxotes jaculatrix]|uniref:uncharacterized protein LOC121194074 isoform X2 n=1 Tax=Toxotes jaculatrix TaxID=941984 RepID=UPI001B3A948E|nr:uncharacterized protein LOC121194074 isoform X2 [Toxotes jaculatrix]
MIGGGGNANPSRSSTTLSTIAIQAGQSQIVVSVLKSGSLVHLQLVQVHPGLCEIGLNREENQTLIQEQQQLMEKLRKHEREVLAVVEQRRSKKNEEVYKAMAASLSEGWSLLLHLLERRQEVLMLASDFYHRALEFADSMDRVEDLQIRPDNNRLTEVQLTYDSMRRDLLGKSLQVITSSTNLLQKLRRLQRAEALQRRGGVLQEEDGVEDESSQCSRGATLRLEELVETLQDRRRTADRALRLRLPQVENGIMVRETERESRESGSDDRTLAPGKVLDQNLESESASTESAGLQSCSREKETGDLHPTSTADVMPGSRSEETVNFESGSDLKPESRSDLEPGIKLDVKPGFRSEETRNSKLRSRSDLQPGFRLEPKTGSGLQEIPNLQSRFRLNLRAGSRSDLNSDSTSEETRDRHQLGSNSVLMPASRSKEARGLQSESNPDVNPDSKSDETSNLQPGSGLDQIPGSRSEQTRDIEPDLKPESRSEENMELQLESKSDIKHESSSDLIPGSNSEKTRNLHPGSDSTPEETRNFESGSRSDMRPRSRLDLKTESRSRETIDLLPGSTSETKELLLNFQPRSKSEKTIDLQSGSRSDPNSRSRSEAEDDSLSRLSRKQDETKRHGPAPDTSGQVQSMLVKETQCVEDHAHKALLTNQSLQLLQSCERLVDKVWSWVQQGSSVLSNSSEAGQQLLEAEDTLNTHLLLHTQAESAGRDAENLRRILDQIQALHTEPTSRTSPQSAGEPSREPSPLKALTEQLKRGGGGRQTRTGAELAGRVDLVLKELRSLNGKIDSNLQLLQPYVAFLRTAQQVEEEMEELREIYRRRPEEEKQEEREAGTSDIRTTTSSRPPQKKKLVHTCWQETLQRLLTAQELGNHYIHTVTMVTRLSGIKVDFDDMRRVELKLGHMTSDQDQVSGSGLNLRSAASVVQRTIEQLDKTKQEVDELRIQQQIQIQQRQEDVKFSRKYQETLLKTLQDLSCVSELLDSSTLVDLGSDEQTSRLLERFRKARPHFIQLDAEVDNMRRSWETLRGVQDRLEVKGVKEEDLSELLKLQKRVKDKIQESKSILDLTSSFHLTANQLEALLRSDPGSPVPGSAGPRGSGEAEFSQHREEQQQIQSLFKTASSLKTDICTAVTCSGRTGFRLEQLEVRLLSLDFLCVSWLNQAARREEKLHQELLTRLLDDDISQLRDSFKELKKRFSNLRFNYLKRNDRTRNMKAVRNQLQQVEQYDEKLQVLKKRLQGVTARLGSEVKNRGMVREVEDAVNELQRQMGEFEQSVREHQKTLDMTCRLQQAVEEYQFWCEEASATIARVGKFSSECRSTEAVSVLYRQFEKFVWPTVPQQEERISQITELALRLHGVEEGRRYIEKTVSKHAEMVESIRELNDGLMELEAKLKLESLKQQLNDGEKETGEDGERRRRRENETEERGEEKEQKVKENRKKKKKCGTPEAVDVYELKETGHTPELTAEHDGKQVPVKRQTAANRKPPLEKSCSREADGLSHRQQIHSETFTSYCSTHTLSLSCSLVEASRRVHAIHSQLQHATPPPPNASARGLSEGELLQHEVMTEDSLSNDEYECASPDDISLPPLAETPESCTVQSDTEEGVCQRGQQCRAPSEHSGDGASTGVVRPQRESSQSEGCPSPPTSLHSTRFNSESTSFVRSPLTVPAPSLLTRTLCTILRTEEIGPADLSQTDSIPHPEEFDQSHTLPKSTCCPQPFNGPDPNLQRLKTLPQDTEVFKYQTTFPQSTTVICQDNSFTQSFPDSESMVTQQTITVQSSSQSKSLPQINPVPQARGFAQNPSLTDSAVHKDGTLPRDIELHKSSGTFLQTSTALPQDSNLPQSCPDSRTGVDQDVPSSKSSKETTSVNIPQSSSLTTTTTVTQQTIYCQPPPSDSHCNVPQACSSLRSKRESPFSQGLGDQPDVHAPVLPEPNGITTSNTASSKQSYQAVYSLHESLTSTYTQQCVHDPGMTPSSPAKPTAPPQPESQTKALAQQANPHVTPPSSPLHLLTSDQDPDICQPLAIREEIKLTPQIQGPSIPAPPLLQAQTESLPQGKASKPGPPYFTRPLSRATVMEGSPVTLEVEVTGHPEPTLTWFKDGGVSATGRGRAQVCEDRERFLFIHEAADSDGRFYEAGASDRRDSQRTVARVFDVIGVDWQTWFGTLCVLLWLIYLILL